ncbi:MAG: site-specific DNA-methyltransferase [Fibrobacteria bacterium]
MTPFFHDEVVTIYHGEALEVLRALPSASIDALVTDPPYSSGGQFRGDRMGTTNEKYINQDNQGRLQDFSGDNRDQRGHLFWCTLWLSECRRLLKPGAPVVLFTDWRQLPICTDILQAGGFIWRGIVPWDKTEGTRPQKGRFRAQAEYAVWGNSHEIAEGGGQISGHSFAEQAEFAAWGSNGPMPSEGQVLPGVWRQSVIGAAKFHVTGKPISVMKSAIGICGAGGTVLDPFGGGGSTAVACKETGRKCVTGDLSIENCEIMKSRMSQGVLAL